MLPGSRGGLPSTVTLVWVCGALLAPIAGHSSQGSSSNCSELLYRLGHDIDGSSVRVYAKPRHKSLPKDEKAKKHYLVLLQQLIMIPSSIYFSWAPASEGQSWIRVAIAESVLSALGCVLFVQGVSKAVC